MYSCIYMHITKIYTVYRLQERSNLPCYARLLDPPGSPERVGAEEILSNSGEPQLIFNQFYQQVSCGWILGS